MLDFMTVTIKSTRSGSEVLPKFRIINKPKDLMIRGGDFYAVWDEERGIWSTDEGDVVRLIDAELDKFVAENATRIEANPCIKYMWDADSGSIDRWHKYCQKQMRDSYRMLDEDLVFSNTEVKRDNYASKRLNYPLQAGSIEAYDKLIGTLYTPEERRKIEWAIGAIVSGDSKTIQKFMVLYGAAGTGKSTILNIIQQLFEGYYAVFDAKALGSANSSFALEPFKCNPLVAIQHDGDLSRIEDNTRLNSLVSHEQMVVNEKFKSSYTNDFKCFLFMGTNKPVKITDAKSGLIRRLIDVTPSNKKVPKREYETLIKRIPFELGAIAQHCLDVYSEDPGYYDDYIPMSMMDATNDFHNFVIDSYRVFKKEDGTTLKVAWEMYKNYCEDAKVQYSLSKRPFQEELKNYFKEFYKALEDDDGTIISGYYKGFKTNMFEEPATPKKKAKKEEPQVNLIKFEEIESLFDKEYYDCFAQYANDTGTPIWKWENVKTKLEKIDTSKVHYVKVPENHIVIDFDIKDENGEKSFERNLAEASKWPATYAELSKSGGGIHLHYIYVGDVTNLSRIYDEDIEIKVFSGNSSLRRRLSKCNNLPIATICSGLPLKEKGGNSVINFDGIKNEKMLRSLLKRHLNKEIMGATKPSVDMIYKCLEEAYASGMCYDVSDMENAIFAFAASSSNQSLACLKLVGKMKFKSEEMSETANESGDDSLIFYDIECFPNLFLVCWKIQGEGRPVIKLINPKPSEIEALVKHKIIGFNNRSYDNHMLYACMLGYNNEQLYDLSQRLVSKDKDVSRKAKFGQAYNLSYTDIYDFASAGNKKSLKKLEIEMGIHHQELGLPWDQPVPPERWDEVADYCTNDVVATEAAFEYLSADWTARQILADIAEMSVNDTTNTLTTRIIFGKNRNPQNQFNYRNLAEPVMEVDEETMAFLKEATPEMVAERFGPAKSILPYFPGYKYEMGKSTYRDVNENNPDPERRVIGEGGYVYAEPGMYGNVALLDVASMHPHSAIAEVLFGVEFTRRFRDIVEGRVEIKHEDWEALNDILDGKLTKFVQKIISGEMSSKDLANGLKTAINAVYGQTSATYNNPFRDIRNKDNIVAKRGALFMIDLRIAVQARGFTVVHCKTDSIKIADATTEIIDFVMNFGLRYGYTFEHEATYDRMCLVNKAVYIAKYATAEKCESLYGYVPGDNKKKGGTWTATGKQFAVPYVFKTLFSNEPITIDDMRETFSVKSALYLDMNEHLPDVTMYESELEKLETKYKKGQLSDTTFESESMRLVSLINDGHDYKFVGRVGEFCPVLPGKGGGILCREQEGKYYAATGTTGYRWLESEILLSKGNEDNIDKSYYKKLVDDAIDAIAQHTDFEWFVSGDPYFPVEPLPGFMSIPDGVNEEIPWD